MQLSIFLVCCVVTLSLGASVQQFENMQLASMEEKLNTLQEDLKQMKHKALGPQPAAAVSSSKKGGWNDITLFKHKNAKEQQASKLKPAGMEKMLLYTNDVDATRKEVSSMGGRVTIKLGHDLVVANIPLAKVNSHFQTASTHVPKSASSQTLRYVKAYWKSVEAEKMEEPEFHLWTDKTAPKTLPQPEPRKGSTKVTMTGKIAVAILIASGPGELKVCENEAEHIISEVMDGLNTLSNAAPESASLMFEVFDAVAPIDVEDNPNCGGYEECHDRFVIPTLNFIGFKTREELEDYIMNLGKAEGAFVSFFSKYTQAHFAYAYFGGGPTYMEYSNDGWGVDEIDRVFAHEVGHVFNAPDEYGGCDCNADYGRGSCTEKNSNCIDCTGTQQECIMNSNQYEVCPYTRKHFGWCGDDDDDDDGGC